MATNRPVRGRRGVQSHGATRGLFRQDLVDPDSSSDLTTKLTRAILPEMRLGSGAPAALPRPSPRGT